MTLTIQDAVKHARSIRAGYWAEGVFPVDVDSIATLMDLVVLEADFQDNISGMIKREEVRGQCKPVIFVNQNHHLNRQRFTIAHELGHYVKRKAEGRDLGQYVDHRDIDSSLGANDDERWANAFAAELLMPVDDFRRSAKANNDPFYLSGRYQVSEEAVRVRARVLKVDLGF